MESCSTSARNTGVAEAKHLGASCADNRLSVLQNPVNKTGKTAFFQYNPHLTQLENSAVSSFNQYNHLSRMGTLACHAKDVVYVDTMLIDSRAEVVQFLSQLDNSFTWLERSFIQLRVVAARTNCALARLQLSLAEAEASFCKLNNHQTTTPKYKKDDLLVRESGNAAIDKQWTRDSVVNLSTVMEDYADKKIQSVHTVSSCSTKNGK